MIQSISILGGNGKNGEPEPIRRMDMNMGDVVSVVGPTGSGKTTFINDIELFAGGDTPTGRRILIDGEPAPAEYRDNPALNPIALITQHTTFLSDLPVRDFLETHARIRSGRPEERSEMIQRTIDFANRLTGEPILIESRMTELSGGQTRSLLIADATIICDTPIVLLDEVENAGIHRTLALEMLRRHKKIFIFVTHDPRIALLSDFRVVIKEGQITQVIHTNGEEKEFARRVSRLDDGLTRLRDQIRRGERLTAAVMEALS